MKFIESHIFNKSPETIYVTMQHLGVKFIDMARCHPDDMENYSEYAGGELAELRATVKALKYERKIAKKKSDEALDFVKSCEGYAKFDPESNTAKVMYRQLNRRIKRVNDLTDEILKKLLSSENKS